MVDFNNFRALFVMVGGFIGAAFGLMYGEVSVTFTVLLILMGVDFVSGLLVAMVFKSSPKSSDGAADSRESLKGLLRKGGMLAVVLVAHWLDVALGTVFIMEGVIVAFIVNEGLSITENMGHAGVPIPNILLDSLSQLENKKDNKDE